MDIRVSWAEERIYYYREGEPQLQWIPVAWTDLSPVDAFVEQSDGRAHFRVLDLLVLRRSLDGGMEEC